MRGSRKSSRGSFSFSFFFFYFTHQSILQRAVRTSLRGATGPRGPVASQGGPYQFFIGNIYMYQLVISLWGSDPMPPSGSAYGITWDLRFNRIGE